MPLRLAADTVTELAGAVTTSTGKVSFVVDPVTKGLAHVPVAVVNDWVDDVEPIVTAPMVAVARFE